MDQLVEIIREEIKGAGAISFARFMELSLYCPIYGYYERERDTIGRRGDFFTSVSVGPVFGELLAFQFSQWLSEISTESKNSRLHIAEAGAHTGDLAGDILAWIRRQRPGIWERLCYHVIEPSSRRQTWQRSRLAEFGDNVAWKENLSVLAGDPANGRPGGGFVGILFSNEFLDALPVRRLGWDARNATWFEWGVTFNAGRFGWARIPVRPGPSLQSCGWPFERKFLAVLPDGFTIEVSPAAEQWWSHASILLTCGKLVAIDYGLTSEELLNPERSNGTLRSYRRHRLCDDVLASPGLQDITAHVNFSAIRAAGESVGLKTQTFTTQHRFLTEIAIHTWNDKTGFAEWSASRKRQFRTLTHPELLGDRFQVLVQARPDPSATT